MNGRRRIVMMEKVPWIRDGIRHAQVELREKVPNVIPAAISPPKYMSQPASKR